MATQLTWYGHAAFKVVTPAGNVLLIDPWITNPSFENGKDELRKLKRVDAIALTHGHGDHVGDAVEIAKKTGAKLVANFDLAAAVGAVLGYPKDQIADENTGHMGGRFPVLDGDIMVEFVPAWHGSSVQKDEKSPPVYAGNPTGIVLEIKNGPTIYTTGDTCFFSDMARVKDYRSIDVMLVCIGDRFTMGPRGAADAVVAVNPGTAIPQHYATFPLLTGTPAEFERELKSRGYGNAIKMPKPGETLTF